MFILQKQNIPKQAGIIDKYWIKAFWIRLCYSWPDKLMVIQTKLLMYWIGLNIHANLHFIPAQNMYWYHAIFWKALIVINPVDLTWFMEFVWIYEFMYLLTLK